MKVKNPVLTGFHPDPSILRVGENYYLATSTFQWFPGVEIFHSTDLANWNFITRPLNEKRLLDMTGIPDSGGVWAPCLSYSDGIYYLVYVANVYYIGGINDTSHKKSVKMDAASVMFVMRSLLVMYEETKEQEFLEGAVKAAKILVTWTYIWDVPYDENTLLGEHGFKTTGWAVCDAIPAGSYVDCSFFEVIPELMRVAELSEEPILKRVAVTVVRGMQHGLSMPQDMYGYAMPGVQCEGYMNSLWLADTEYKEFSGAAAKNKGDDNDTCNGFVNGMALLALDYMNHH